MDEITFRLQIRQTLKRKFNVLDNFEIKSIIERVLDAIDPEKVKASNDFEGLIAPYISPENLTVANISQARELPKKARGQRYPNDQELFKAIHDVKTGLTGQSKSITDIKLPKGYVGFSAVRNLVSERGLTLNEFYLYNFRRGKTADTGKPPIHRIPEKVKARAVELNARLIDAFTFSDRNEIHFLKMFNALALHTLIYEEKPEKTLLGVDTKDVDALFESGSIKSLQRFISSPADDILTLEAFALETGFTRKDSNGEAQPVLAYADIRL